MFVIGLTGGISSGKSTVEGILSKLGAYIIDTDRIAREVVQPQKTAWREIVQCFGERVLALDGTIDRKALGEIVFKDSNFRQRLEEITHPRILECVRQEMAEAEQKGIRILVLDVPLLIEAGWRHMADEVWVVYVDSATQRSRLMKRDGIPCEQAQQRIRAQMNLEDKVRHGDVVIDNSGNLAQTTEQVVTAWRRINNNLLIINSEDK